MQNEACSPEHAPYLSSQHSYKQKFSLLNKSTWHAIYTRHDRLLRLHRVQIIENSEFMQSPRTRCTLESMKIVDRPRLMRMTMFVVVCRTAAIVAVTMVMVMLAVRMLMPFSSSLLSFSRPRHASSPRRAICRAVRRKTILLRKILRRSKSLRSA